VAELERELSALWRSEAAGSATEHGVTRACSLTLLVYVESQAAEGEALELIDRVTPENPCRAVIMAAEPAAAPAGLFARISARCYLPTGGAKAVCCEQISVLARGEAVAGLDQVVIPLIVPGLAAYLWWRAGRFAPPRFLDPILRSSDRVLVDSGRFPDPEADLPRLVDELRRLAAGAVLTDLNWARLTPWRELIAQCFDSPATRPALDQLAEVRFEYEQDSRRVRVLRAQFLLLTGWLASRLGWQPLAERSEEGLLFRSGDRAIRVESVSRGFEGGGGEGVCVSLTLKTAGAKTAVVRCELPGRPTLERAVRLQVLDEIDLLNGEIKFAVRDRVYEEALEMIARLPPRPAGSFS
jgi:glucose-6-phosphate dehydrogenase assembly protein OpcA